MTMSDGPTTAAAFTADGAAAGAWTLDPAASRIEFHSKSMWGMAKVHGVFGTVSGSGTVAADGTVTGRVVVDAASVDSKVQKRDDHLRSKDFFHVDEHPEITFAVTGITPQGGDTVEVRGTLTARGHDEAVTFTATLSDASAEAVTLAGELAVDRSRFGMTWSPMKMATMHNRIVVSLRFRKEQ